MTSTETLAADRHLAMRLESQLIRVAALRRELTQAEDVLRKLTEKASHQ